MSALLRRQESVGSGSTKSANIDKLYAGFFDTAPKVYDFDGAELQQQANTSSPMLTTTAAAALRSSYMGGRLTTQSSVVSRLGTAATVTLHRDTATSRARPSTAIRGVGYTSDTRRTFDIQTGPGHAKKPVVADSRKEQSPDEKYRMLERKIQDLLEQSILMGSSTTVVHGTRTTIDMDSGDGTQAGNSKPDLRAALNKAKEASALDRKLLQLRDQSVGNFVHNFDLTFSVLFNLATLYAANEMHIEALNTYNMMTRNKMFANANRLKVNMGNIYVRLGLFPKAIKMYRMALDQVPINQKELRLRVTHNIGVLFVRMGQYSDAAASFEFVMSERGDMRAGLHLVLCYYALGDVVKMKRAFQMLLEVTTAGLDDDDKFEMISSNVTQEYIMEVMRTDELSQWESKQQQFARKAILMTANLIAAVIEETFDEGYTWCVDTIKSSKHQQLASELDLHRAIMFLKQDDPAQAIESLQYFEKRETNVAINASINLTFIYLMMNNLPMGTRYAESMRRLDSYNPATFINNGVCEMMKREFETARTMFEAALEIDATSFEALYNLGLIWKQFNDYDMAMSYFRKLNMTTVHETHPQVLYQIGSLYERQNDPAAALEFYLQLLGSPFLDAEILRKIGDLYEREDDQQLAFHYHFEAYRLNPSNATTTNWVGTHYIRLQVAERAIPYYERAILNDPTNAFYMIRAAGCYMKVGQHKKALRFFQDIYKRFPDNPDCLRALIRITHTGHPQLNERYKAELQKLAKAKETRKRIISGNSGRAITSASLLSGGGGGGTGSAGSHDDETGHHHQRQSRQQNMHSSSSATVMNASQVAHEINEQYEREYYHQSKGSSAPGDRGQLQQQQQPEEALYSDPLGPMAERPRTAARPKTGYNEDTISDEDINPDEMLPE